MGDRYGVPLPAPILVPGSYPAVQAIGDPFLGFTAEFIKSVMMAYVGDAWTATQPGKPMVKEIRLHAPEEGFNEAWLPALYMYRSPRETRETVESFEYDADEYRYEKSRVSVRWILDAAPNANRQYRGPIINAVRKTLDRSITIGRDTAWKVPGDPDPKAPGFGSSLANYAGFAVLELQRARPSIYTHRMTPPAPPREYEELLMSLYIEELLDRDANLVGDPHESLEAGFQSPDQGTGFGPLNLGDAFYEE